MVALGTTEHDCKNLFATLAAAGHDVAVSTSLAARRFQDASLERTKIDAIDAQGLAHLAFEKRPAPSCLPDGAAEALRKRVGHRDRLRQDFDDRVRQHHDGPAYALQARHICHDVDLWRTRLADVERDSADQINRHDVGKLIETVEVTGPQTAARVIVAAGDPAQFRSAASFAAFVGVLPSLRQSGKRTAGRAGIGLLGHARLRRALWMPTLGAVRRNDWQKPLYERLRAARNPQSSPSSPPCASSCAPSTVSPKTESPHGRDRAGARGVGPQHRS